MKALKITGAVVFIIVLGIAGVATYLKTALPDTGPAPDLKIERSAQRVARGRYLANHVSVCIDCHSKRDWSLFSAPLVNGSEGGGGEAFNQEMGFPGRFYASNITPYGLGDWSDGEIFRAITTGVDKDGKALFPVMPYPHIGRMDREDVYSIIAYLRTLAPVKNDVPQSAPDFPVNFLINTMPQPAAFSKMPDTGKKVEYGRYLVNAAGCVDCHSKKDKGNIVAGSEFGGGMEFRQPGGVVRAPNITMHQETGIGDWTSEAFVRRFRKYADSNYRAEKLSPGELNSPMPWTMYGGMRPYDLEAIYSYLQSLKPIANKVQKFETVIAYSAFSNF